LQVNKFPRNMRGNIVLRQTLPLSWEGSPVCIRRRGVAEGDKERISGRPATSHQRSFEFPPARMG